MNQRVSIPAGQDIPRFDRRFFESENVISCIGGGGIGGKASGLVFAHQTLRRHLPDADFEGMQISVPRLVVIGTDVFDAFMSRNNLCDMALGDTADDRIAVAFQRAEFPAEFVGDLRGLIASVHSPLAIRSSSMLEDAMYEPFAGVYGTKMTPNNQPDADTRSRKLVEAVKFVYASTFFREAKAYMNIIGRSPSEEKMAVIIQEVVGDRYGDRFYPGISGVARSYNFYTYGHALPEDGVVDLALGLGKTIVDGGLVWSYCPKYPNANPPFTTAEILKNTQTEFWAVNMGKPAEYDPTRETEYLTRRPAGDADEDGLLAMLASTYQPQNDRIVMGTGHDGPRVLNFAPIIRMDDVPLNSAVKFILNACTEELHAPVEIEFATVVDPRRKAPSRFGFLQVRPLVVSEEDIEIEDSDLTSEQTLVASLRVLGNGVLSHLTDVVYVKPDDFRKADTPLIAREIDALNRGITAEGRRYVLIGFGRWGSSDPWLGIPVDWSNISGVQVLVEATLPDMHVELSQGSHFFHNLTSLQLCYFSVPHTGTYSIDWAWLQRQVTVRETDYVRHIRLETPLLVKVDGRRGKGVILR